MVHTTLFSSNPAVWFGGERLPGITPPISSPVVRQKDRKTAYPHLNQPRKSSYFSLRYFGVKKITRISRNNWLNDRSLPGGLTLLMRHQQ
jgi:hypothetical protein